MKKATKKVAGALGGGAVGGAALGTLLTLAIGSACFSGAQADPNTPKERGGDESAKVTVPETEALKTARSLGQAFTSVADTVSQSVVSLRVEQRQKLPQNPFQFFGPFGRRGPHGPQGDGDRYGVRQGAGSGVIIRSDGYILTNNHVVENATNIEVVMRDDRRLDGEVVGSDPATDLAVVKVDASGLPTADFADSSQAKVGSWVLAIGAPFGLEYTTTAGVVSAKGRAVGAAEIEDYIQTDASINPGNSGGPLVTLDGEVLGINTMIVGRGTGIGFAVPSNLARSVADQIISNGTVKRAWIGVTFQELTPELAEGLELESRDGALVSSVVDDGPAAEAGLEAGDVIVAVDGEEIQEGRDLLRYVLRKQVGQKVELTLVRDGERKKIELTTGERPTKASRAGEQGGGASPSGAEQFGLGLQPLTEGLARRLGMPDAEGVVVAAVKPGSPAQRAGLRKGDVIVEADREAVRSPDGVAEALEDGRALLRVRRDDGAVFIVLEK